MTANERTHADRPSDASIARVFFAMYEEINLVGIGADAFAKVAIGKARELDAAKLAQDYRDAYEGAREDLLDEPVAARYDFDGFGWQYIDNGSGSDWASRIEGAELLYTRPRPAPEDIIS